MSCFSELKKEDGEPRKKSLLSEMVTFSVSGITMGRRRRRRRTMGPSAPSPSSPPASCSSSSELDSGEEEGGEREGAEEQGVPAVAPSPSPSPGFAVGFSSASSSGKGRGVDLITVSVDPDVLECPICCEPLSPPVFQCSNGHIACSKCCTQMKNKCHSCYCSIDSSRCLALEKIIESIQVPCPHAENGCRETVIYAKVRGHKETCIYAPCSCPFPNCKFDGSVMQLSIHFCSKHRGHAIPFYYNTSFAISLDQNKPMLVLHGEDGVLYILCNRSVSPFGISISLTSIGPSCPAGGVSYDLQAKSGESDVKLTAPMRSIKQWTGASSFKEYLHVPHYFFDFGGHLDVELCIRNVNFAP